MKTKPETLVLALALGFLALGAGALGYLFPDIQDLTNVKSTQPSNPHSLHPLHAADLQASFSAWTAPASWPEPANQHLLFISDPYLFYPARYPTGDYIAKLDENARSNKGVLISWYRKHHLDFTAPNVDDQDPDGDGFSNIVEFKNEQPGQRLDAFHCDGSNSTDPLDPQSHPSYLSRLRLEKYDSVPFHIEFRGYQEINGVYQFQLYLRDVPSEQQPRLKKTGDPLGLEGYIVGDFHLNNVQEKDVHTGIVSQVDESTLDLLKPDIDYKITLTFRKEVDAPESTASLVMLMPSEVGKEIKVARDKVFSVPFITDKQFRLVDVSDAGAVIRDADPKNPQKIPILKLIPSEWDDVPQSKSP
ncbi:MAG: hypothetical protein LV481_13115 [Methylacidiphilales bacterium]|nr:hypothetical protein [Candidatus Methylacidiphilales bacterium]